MNKWLLLVFLLISSLGLVYADNYPVGTWLGYNSDTGKFLPVALNASGSALVEGIGSVPESYYKSAIDTANQEVSADFDAAAALVTSNYADISAAIASKGVDMTGVIPSGYDAKIAEAVELKEREALFAFRDEDNTIYPGGYNTELGGVNIIVPPTIRGVEVKHYYAYANDGILGRKKAASLDMGNLETIGSGAFRGNAIKDIVFSSKLVTIGGEAFSNNGYSKPITLPASVEQCDFRFNSIPFLDMSACVNMTTIGGSAFRNNAITELILPLSITSVGARAFYANPIVKIVIGSNVSIVSDFYSTFGSYGDAFEALYNGNGKLAGTYEYSGGTWTKTL